MDYRIRSARRADLPAVYELVDACFPFAHPDLFVRQTESDSSHRLWQTRLLEVDGRIVSHVRIFDRAMWVRGVRLRAGGIGSVATHPDYRKFGFATALLEDAIDQMERRGYHLSFLFTGITHFYARLGWRVVRQPYYAVKANEAAGLPRERGVRLRPFAPAHLPALAEIYKRRSGRRTGAIARSERYWRDHLTWTNEDAGGFLVAEARGRPVAYVRSRIEIDKHLNLLEGAALPGREGALRSLLASLGDYAASRGAADIRGLVPADSDLAGLLSALPLSRMTMEIPLPDMMRVVDLEGMLGRLLPDRDDWKQLKADRDEWVLAVMGQARVGELLGRSKTAPTARRTLDDLERALPPEPLHFWNSDRI